MDIWNEANVWNLCQTFFKFWEVETIGTSEKKMNSYLEWDFKLQQEILLSMAGLEGSEIHSIPEKKLCSLRAHCWCSIQHSSSQINLSRKKHILVIHM